MKLKPLQQWYCDTCGQVIEKPEDGWLEWGKHDDTNQVSGFHITHNAHKSPRGGEQGCYQYKYGLDSETSIRSQDNHLQYFLRPDGLAYLLSLVHEGPQQTDDISTTDVVDFSSWTEVVRRLHIPYYEEYRGYLRDVRADGYGGRTYLEEDMIRFIENYEKQREEE